jgi:hypothetical protein
MEGTPTPSSTPTPSTPAPSSKNGASSGTQPPSPSAPSKAANGEKGGGSLAKAPEAGSTTPAVPEDFLEIVDGKSKRRLSKDEAIRQLQKGLAGDRKLQEASEQIRQAKEFWDGLEADPWALLEKRGINLDAMLEKRLAEKAKVGLMTPEERAVADLKAQLQERDSQLQAFKEERAKAERAAKEEKLFAGFEKAILDAAQQHNLETTPETYAELANIAIEQLNLGLPLEPGHLAAEVKEKQGRAAMTLAKHVAGGLQGENLLSYLGPQTVEAVLRASLAKVQSSNPYQEPAPEPPAATGHEAPQRKRGLDPIGWRKKFGY